MARQIEESKLNSRLESVYKVIEKAKEHLDEDPHLANYMLRDIHELSDARLDDLSWSIHRDEYCSREDVKDLIKKFEEYLKKQK